MRALTHTDVGPGTKDTKEQVPGRLFLKNQAHDFLKFVLSLLKIDSALEKRSSTTSLALEKITNLKIKNHTI